MRSSYEYMNSLLLVQVFVRTSRGQYSEPIDTPMISELLGDEDFRKAIVAPVPMGRAARPKQIADVAVFLAGPGASYVNGAIVPVDGGWSAR